MERAARRDAAQHSRAAAALSAQGRRSAPSGHCGRTASYRARTTPTVAPASRCSRERGGRRGRNRRCCLVAGGIARFRPLRVGTDDEPARLGDSSGTVAGWDDDRIHSWSFQRVVPFARGQVYVKSLPDGEPVQLTHDKTAKMSPVFSPDVRGSHIRPSTVNSAGTPGRCPCGRTAAMASQRIGTCLDRPRAGAVLGHEEKSPHGYRRSRSESSRTA